ncbi:hypothetical protein PVMG_04610 [Plasmodium vivax Mauritania I]|uniref:VIR protein n=1 Tax=Plasmodium vivax Mauritania I TaxID=1035515 RepID=A0A0J9T2Z9_PLAVI|nr:hypothetical protein PVMG_04610 [Plasmodium vivax Mauritania I]
MVSAYNSFNDDVNSGERSAILSILNYIKTVGGYKNEDHVIYEKLIRNLWSLFNNIYKEKGDYCIFLNHWLYLIKKKYKIVDFPIDVFYSVTVNKLTSDGKKNICPFYSYDTNYNEPINIIKLQNFHRNVNTIRGILIKESDPQERNSQYCYAQRYANECVKIYRKMHDMFCSSNTSLSTKNQNTCSELGTFSSIYTNYLFNEGDINTKIPNLTSSENEKHFLCPSDKLPTPEELKQEAGPALGMGTESGPGHSSVSVGVEQQNNPIKLNSTAIVGTMAGIPPFLALIYKVNIFFHKTIKNT